jgi:hypothetical protein
MCLTRRFNDFEAPHSRGFFFVGTINALEKRCRIVRSREAEPSDLQGRLAFDLDNSTRLWEFERFRYETEKDLRTLSEIDRP